MAISNSISRAPVAKNYLVTRNQALRISPSNFTQFMTKNTIYGVIIDMPMAANFITTMACFVNGAANLYFSNGNDYSGAAQRYPGVVQATRVFVSNIANYLDDAQKVTSYPLPAGRTHFVYILTTGGVYKLELDSTSANQDQKQRILMNLYQRVMNELHQAQMKDKAANGGNV
ncbi:MAG: hypothetical protein MJ062_04740 [Oscillospiraceae bacterium]|nr:hypothetical protein [Oscillospiraceae bacterium]